MFVTNEPHAAIRSLGLLYATTPRLCDGLDLFSRSRAVGHESLGVRRANTRLALFHRLLARRARHYLEHLFLDARLVLAERKLEKLVELRIEPLAVYRFEFRDEYAFMQCLIDFFLIVAQFFKQLLAGSQSRNDYLYILVGNKTVEPDQIARKVVYIYTGSPISSTNTSPLDASAPACNTSRTASGIVIKYRLIFLSVTVTGPPSRI